MSVKRRQVLPATTSAKSARRRSRSRLRPTIGRWSCRATPTAEASRSTSRCAGTASGLPFRLSSSASVETRVPHEPQRVVPEEDLPGTRSLFQARGDVHRITSDESASLAGDDGAGVDADPGLEPQLVHDIAQLYRRARRSQRVVLGRDGNAEHRHHRVADELFHRPPVPFEHDPSRVVVPVHQRTQSLWIGAVADRRRPRQVAEQHRDDFSDLARRSRGQRRSAPGAELEVVGALSSAMRARHHGRESMSLPPHRGRRGRGVLVCVSSG